MAVVIGFVLADVEPFAVVVGGSPAPGLVDREEPSVVAFAKFRQSFFAGLAENIQIVVEIVAFDGFAGGFAEFHGDAKFFLVSVREILQRVPSKVLIW